MHPLVKLLRALVSVSILSGLALSVFGFVGWRSSLRVPSEKSLVLVEGRVVSAVEVKRRRRGTTRVKFQLSGHPQEWQYSSNYPNYQKARFRLIPEARVRLWALPEAGRWRPRIWRMEVSGATIATFEMMESYSRRNGRWGLALAICSLLASAYMFWFYWQQANAGLVLERWRRDRRRRLRHERQE